MSDTRPPLPPFTLQTAIQKLREMIIAGRYPSGAKLPPEADLAAELGLSRNTTREAVRALSTARVLDVRRGDGPQGCFDYTMASIATTQRLIDKTPEVAAAAVRAIVKTQNALKTNVAQAAEVGVPVVISRPWDTVVERAMAAVFG